VANSGLRFEADVLDAFPNATFKVKYYYPEIDRVTRKETGKLLEREALCGISGKMRLHQIKVCPGDRVTVELGETDLTKGRIVHRL
jgi:translation initiation factor IF-1